MHTYYVRTLDILLFISLANRNRFILITVYRVLTYVLFSMHSFQNGPPSFKNKHGESAAN